LINKKVSLSPNQSYSEVRVNVRLVMQEQ